MDAPTVMVDPAGNPSRGIGGVSRRLAAILLGVSLALLATEFVWRELQLNQVARDLAAQRSKATDERAVAAAQQDLAVQSRLAQEAAEHRSQLQDSAWLSGSLARERHEKEWALRLAHDPQLAQTILETNLLTMEQLGQDASVAAQTALEKVARLAAPRDSRVEVMPDGDGFRVRVAFMMSRLSKQESGAVTKHHTTDSMRGEIQELSARVLRDLYDFCGSRGIRAIAVTCNHTLRQSIILPGATQEEQALLLERAKPVPARLYRVNLDETHARSIVDWRRVSLSRVTQLYTVEYDGLVNLTITQTQLGNQHQRDAEGELQF